MYCIIDNRYTVCFALSSGPQKTPGSVFSATAVRVFFMQLIYQKPVEAVTL